MIILYPTETIYGLGVNALDPRELAKLYELKGREAGKAASWLVRSIDDIEKYAEMSGTAAKIGEQFLPGPLTLVLEANEDISDEVLPPDRTIGFRISTDQVARELIEEFMTKHEAPLTCTSANISGVPTLSTPTEILAQFGEKASMIDRVIDDGPRTGLATTVVKIVGDDVTILREGMIPKEDILSMI